MAFLITHEFAMEKILDTSLVGRNTLSKTVNSTLKASDIKRLYEDKNLKNG